MLGGVALAREVTGTSGSDDLEGTNRADKIWGLQGPDYIASEQGSDDLYGGRGKVEVRGALCWVMKAGARGGRVQVSHVGPLPRRVRSRRSDRLQDFFVDQL